MVTNNGLLDESKILSDDKSKSALINRLGILGDVKPTKKFMLINNPNV